MHKPCSCQTAAIQRELLRGVATEQPARERGRLRIDRPALRRALGGRDEVIEAMQAKAVGRPGANASVMWRYFTTSVYQSGDLPVLATREALQNSVDAIKAGIRARKTRAGAGRFEVTWDADRRALTWADNGIGMDTTTILEKFLSLGESGKSEAGSSEEAAGGFGVAKAVILGTSTSFSWELHSRDNLAVSKGADRDVEVFDAPFLQGTRITIFDVAEGFGMTWDYARQEHVGLLDRLRELLAANDLKGVSLTLNGTEVRPMFSRRGGSKVGVDGSWGRGTTAAIKAYRRPPGDRQGAYYVRLGGLFQFKTPSQRGNLKADVVVDLVTSVRPGASAYPLNAARDGVQGRARWTFRDLVDEVERENESVGRSLEDEVFDPDSDDASERAEADRLAELTAEAFEDDDFQKALAEAAGGISDFYAERAKEPGVERPVASLAPPGTKARPAEDVPTRGVVLPAGIDVAVVAVQGDIASPSTPAEAATLMRAVLEAAHQIAEDAGGQDPTVILSADVSRALDRAEAGEQLDEREVVTLQRALDAAADVAVSPNGGGLLHAAAVSHTGDTALGVFRVDEQADRQRKQKRNPFGRLAGLRISRKNYDRRKASRFKKNFQRWIPHLTAWDATLRLIASEARIRRRFKPGFVLDDELLGLTTSTSRGLGVVYIHPDRLAQVVKAHKRRPLAIAAYLHGVACHELTHLDGRMGEGHSEEYVAAREDLGHATGHLLPAIAVMVTKVLGLKLKPSDEEKQVAKLERKLEQARASSRSGKAALARVVKLEQALVEAQTELAEAQAESRRVRATCGASCRSCGKGEGWATPGTRLRGATLREWVEAWNVLKVRRSSSARHAALRAHVEALPDAIVEQAAPEDLPGFEEILRAARPPRGKRAGTATTRLFDALDRRRRQLGLMVQAVPPESADHVLEAAVSVLRTRPPAGVDLAYLDGFIHRHRPHLRDLVQGALDRRASRAAT